MNNTTKLELLRKALAAGQAVVEEIERRNSEDNNSFRQTQREPALQRARAIVSDCERAIRDLEATTVEVELKIEILVRLTDLETKLDDAIEANGLIGLGMTALGKIIEDVEEAKTALA
jgi:hypothetical protein